MPTYLLTLLSFEGVYFAKTKKTQKNQDEVDLSSAFEGLLESRDNSKITCIYLNNATNLHQSGY